MRNIATRNVLLLIGMSAFVLMAATGLALVKEASARARVEITKSGRYYYARDWKRPTGLIGFRVDSVGREATRVSTFRAAILDLRLATKVSCCSTVS